MSNEDSAKKNLPDRNDAESGVEEKIDRREVVSRAKKFLAYTAPAMIALITAKDACAN